MSNSLSPRRSICLLQKAIEIWFYHLFFKHLFILSHEFFCILAKAQKQEVNTKDQLTYHEHKAKKKIVTVIIIIMWNISLLSKVKLAPLLYLNTEFITNTQLDSVHTFCFLSPGSLCLRMLKVGVICTSSEVQTPHFNSWSP